MVGHDDSKEVHNSKITLQSKVPLQATKARITRNETYRLSLMGSFFKQKVECRLNIPLFLREQEASVSVGNLNTVLSCVVLQELFCHQ